jgi:anti-sigma factor RsiW
MSDGEDCKRVLLTQADFDGELDAAEAAGLAAHREECAQCRAAYQSLAMVRAAMRDDELYHRAPDSLRAALLARAAPAERTEAAPVAAAPTPRRWWPAANFGMGAALAAGIALLLTFSGGDPGLTDRIVDDHVRALQPGHLWDVESTDRHTVKPWFDGRIDFAPPVKDLAAQQFPLKGGRLDYIGGRQVAGLVYEHGHHPIDLLVWPAVGTATSDPTVTARNGYNVIHWTQDGMTLWAVSDLERAQLSDFVELWRKAP